MIKDIINMIDDMDNSTADKLFNRKHVNDKFKFIGKGGQGIVYKIKDSTLALKVSKITELSKNELYINSIINSRRADDETDFDDINIIKVYHTKKIDKYALILMDLADGSLPDWISEKQTDCSWMKMIFQIIMGVHTLQTKYHMYHADLKPKNILFKKLDKIKTIAYIYNGKRYDVKTDIIFLISDFGHSITVTHSGKYKPKDVEAFISGNADLYELASIYKRIAVDSIKCDFTLEDLMNFPDAELKTYFVDMQKKIDKSTLPEKVKQNLLARALIYFLVEKKIFDISQIKTLPSTPIINLLDSLLFLDMDGIVKKSFELLGSYCI